jgi:hypothetical protein
MVVNLIKNPAWLPDKLNELVGHPVG